MLQGFYSTSTKVVKQFLILYAYANVSQNLADLSLQNPGTCSNGVIIMPAHNEYVIILLSKEGKDMQDINNGDHNPVKLRLENYSYGTDC